MIKCQKVWCDVHRLTFENMVMKNGQGLTATSCRAQRIGVCGRYNRQRSEPANHRAIRSHQNMLRSASSCHSHLEPRFLIAGQESHRMSRATAHRRSSRSPDRATYSAWGREVQYCPARPLQPSSIRRLRERGGPPPENPQVFLRLVNTLVAHNQPMVRSRISGDFDYEGELALIAHHRIRERALPTALRQRSPIGRSAPCSRSGQFG
jgi:hypothetical protein